MKKECWADSEVKDLFLTVEDVKDSNKPLKDAFVAHAQKYSRKPNSVRNFYYNQLVQLKKDLIRTKRLGIDLSRHEKLEVEYFSPEDQDRLISDIDRLVKSGMSIRKACLKLSGGDINLMLRYQNKYRNYILKQSKRAMPDNIIKFSKKKMSLSDEDINSLFLGLVRLVKRTAEEQASSRYKTQNQNSNDQLRKMLVQLNQKDREVEKLKAEYAKIKSENAALIQKMMKLECQKVEKLNK